MTAEKTCCGLRICAQARWTGIPSHEHICARSCIMLLAILYEKPLEEREQMATCSLPPNSIAQTLSIEFITSNRHDQRAQKDKLLHTSGLLILQVETIMSSVYDMVMLLCAELENLEV